MAEAVPFGMAGALDQSIKTNDFTSGTKENPDTHGYHPRLLTSPHTIAQLGCSRRPLEQDIAMDERYRAAIAAASTMLAGGLLSDDSHPC